MKEILNFHIGQAGVQLGSSVWELFCLEHAISESGKQVNEKTISGERVDSYFSVNLNNRFVPRCVFIDLEPTVVDEIKMGSIRDLFHPDRYITSFEDAASNFARGFFTVGKLLLNRITQATRKMYEECEHMNGIMLFRSLGGGTGSGLTSALFDALAEYPKTPKVELPVYPSPTLSSSTVEPYNAVLAEHFCIEDTDLSLLFDNEALYDISFKYLYYQNPTFTFINRIISQVISSLTASLRFENTLNNDISVLQVNLVPYPRIHFPLCNFSPIACINRHEHEKITTDYLTSNVFDRDNQMVKIDPSMGRYMSCALFYRGKISPYDVYVALSHVKRDKKLDFVEWCPTGFKVGINSSTPGRIPESHLGPASSNLAMLTNSSAIGQAFQRISHKFYLLYAKRSFLHWFVGEGMEEMEFTESLFNITALVKDYEEVSKDSSEHDKTELTEATEKSEKSEKIEKVEKTSSGEENSLLSNTNQMNFIHKKVALNI